MSEGDVRAELLRIVEPSGQQHVLAHWDALTAQQREHLAAECKNHLRSAEHLSFLIRVLERSVALTRRGAEGTIEAPSPTEVTRCEQLPSAERAAYSDKGLRLVAAKQTAVVILAGGSGTRLGITVPKGVLECPQLALHRSLFEMHCGRIRKVEALASAPPGSILVPVMTSEQTHGDTIAFFEAKGYFGLKPEQVVFFQQSSLPCFTGEGQILLQEPYCVALAPGGNGGVWEALKKHGVTERMQKAGVQYIQIITVDNLLARAADPVFLGFAAEKRLEVAVKTCPKAHDHEPVGVFAKRDGKWGVVEYTEVGRARAELHDATTGVRVFDCANIAIHLVTVDFLEKAAQVMDSMTEYHAARKAIPTSVMPDRDRTDGKCFGWKLEAFIFDVFQFADSFAILSVDRSKEFAPVKNADHDDPSVVAPDSPASAVALLHRLHASWFLRHLEHDPDVRATGLSELGIAHALRVEVAPEVSYEGEGLSAAQVAQFKEWLLHSAELPRPPFVVTQPH